MPRVRHFGATMAWDEWELLSARLSASSPGAVVEPAAVSFRGQPVEQGKMMIVDPSGNLIEIKAYRHPGAVLGPFVT